MSDQSDNYGRTIQIFLVDGSPNGLMIASLHGWTGSITVCKQATFDKLLKRQELDRTGVYILWGQDPENPLKMRAYIGEADSVKERINESAQNHEFWETAVAITTSDDALTKGHVRYLEARLIEIATAAGRATLANTQKPSADKRKLPEADKANMEGFLANLRVVLPVVGLDLLKPIVNLKMLPPLQAKQAPHFELIHPPTGLCASAIEENDEFIVLEGSEALKDAGYSKLNYSTLKTELIEQGILKISKKKDRFTFASSYTFSSVSAAASVILDRNANGRVWWKVKGQKTTYHEWQSQTAGAGE